MNKAIYKYEVFLNGSDEDTLTLPKGAIFRSVYERGHKVCVWFEVDTEEKETEDRKFVIYETGRPFKNYRHEFLVAIFPHDAMFVFHIYEVFE